jgi:protein O-mannosyl-transferase
MKKLENRFRLMIAVLAVTAYAPTLKMGFLWDDHVMIEANPAIRSWSPANLKHDFTTDVFDGHGDRYYRPLQTVFNRIDYTIWKLRPFGYHLTNLLFHIGSAILVAELAICIGLPALTALLAGCLFAVHPIGVEQLMIIAGRAELMGLFFSLATILLFVKNTRQTIAWGWVAYIAALLSKESSVVIPFLLALVFYVRQEKKTAYKRLIPLGLVVIPYMMWRTHVVGPVVEKHDLWFTTRFFTQAFPVVIFKYLSLLAVPWNLHSHRLLPRLSHFWLIYLLLVSGGAFFLIKTFQRRAVFFIGWFLLSLLPKTPVMIYGNFMLDHWAYPATPAVIIPLAMVVAWGWGRREKWIRSATAFLYFSTLIVWALLTHLNVSLRGTDEKMYRWSLRFSTSNPVKYNLGVLLLDSRRPEEAARYFEEVKALYPEDPRVARALSIAYWESGHRWVAIRFLEDFVKIYPAPEPLREQLRKMKETSAKK